MTEQRERRVRQSGRSQFFDAAVLLVLLFATLFATTWIVERFSAEQAAAEDPAQVQQIDELPISADERRQYEDLVENGVIDEQGVNEQVANNAPSEDKYPINPVLLVITVVLLVGYLAFVYRVSFTEYRQVIEHKFGRKDGQR